MKNTQKELKKWEKIQEIGVLPEVKELQGKVSTKVVADLQANIIFKRNLPNLVDHSDLGYFTLKALYVKAASHFNMRVFGLLAVFAYGIEEGKRLERKKRK